MVKITRIYLDKKGKADFFRWVAAMVEASPREKAPHCVTLAKSAGGARFR